METVEAEPPIQGRRQGVSLQIRRIQRIHGVLKSTRFLPASPGSLPPLSPPPAQALPSTSALGPPITLPGRSLGDLWRPLGLPVLLRRRLEVIQVDHVTPDPSQRTPKMTFTSQGPPQDQ